MHISPTVWDTQTAYACLLTAPIPASGWIFDPPAYVNIFGLEGGISDWQIQQQQGRPAPTIEVRLDEALEVTGWVTQSTNPNDDNVGLWAASDQVLPSWSYILKAVPAPGPKTRCLSVSKHASPNPVPDGALLTYTLHVTNTAGVKLTTTIMDILPSHVQPSGVLDWGPLNIDPGDTWMQQFNVTVQQGYTGELRNRVQVMTEEGPLGWAGVTVCANQCLYHMPVILKAS